MIDVVCSKYKVGPRFVAKHFDYGAVRFGKTSSVEAVNRGCYENISDRDIAIEVMSAFLM